jgi:hypothetical protein
MDGMLLFARFAFMPNRLGYCGTDANAELVAYLKEGRADGGLRRHLATFSGALPHLRLIAESTGIADPFDERVVEAYWIGNELLEHVDWTRHARRLREQFQSRLRPSTVDLLVGKPQAGARAHHAFHVFDLSFRTGLPGGDHALDLCRIGWGTIVSVDPGAYTVVYEPIIIDRGRLAFGPPQPLRVLRTLGDDPLADDGAIGDVLAFHWRFACMRLSAPQAANLAHYTRGMMALANQTF